MIEPGSRFFASAAVCVSAGSWSTLASWPSYRRVRSTSIGELQRIAVDSSDGRPSGQSWGTFLRNHLPQIACRAIHSVVGCPVTSIQTSSSRASQTMTRTYSRLKPMVGTTIQVHGLGCSRPSQAAISSSLLRSWGAGTKGKRGAELSRFCAPLLYNMSGVPPNVPPRRPRER